MVDENFEMSQDQTVQATSIIRMSALVDQNNLVIKAGEAVELLPGFQSMEGTEVQLFITPCNR